MSKTLILLIGLENSGKSTYAEKLVQPVQEINLSLIGIGRSNLGKVKQPVDTSTHNLGKIVDPSQFKIDFSSLVPTPQKPIEVLEYENLISQMVNKVDELMKENENMIIVSDNNLLPTQWIPYLEIAQENGYSVQFRLPTNGLLYYSHNFKTIDDQFNHLKGKYVVPTPTKEFKIVQKNENDDEYDAYEAYEAHKYECYVKEIQSKFLSLSKLSSSQNFKAFDDQFSRLRNKYNIKVDPKDKEISRLEKETRKYEKYVKNFYDQHHGDTKKLYYDFLLTKTFVNKAKLCQGDPEKILKLIPEHAECKRVDVKKYRKEKYSSDNENDESSDEESIDHFVQTEDGPDNSNNLVTEFVDMLEA
jgi:hypothetical protein